MTRRTTAKSRLAALLKAADRPGRTLILMQDNPDPDAIGSAYALREILKERLGKRAAIGYGGTVGRAENRAMLDELRIAAQRIGPDDFDSFKTICLVDTQPRTGNNALPGSTPAHVVIDHHETAPHLHWEAAFADVRPAYGATATMLWEYLGAAGLDLTGPLATALLYGIQSDTQDLGGETSAADMTAYHDLYVRADKRKLAAIRRAPVDAEYFAVLRDSLERSVVAGKAVITFVHGDRSADIFAEIADRMLRLRGMESSVCFGRSGPVVYISARSFNPRTNCMIRMRKVVEGIGTGGGHGTMAGGQVPINARPRDTMSQVYRRILTHFAGGRKPAPLLPDGRPGFA